MKKNLLGIMLMTFVAGYSSPEEVSIPVKVTANLTEYNRLVITDRNDLRLNEIVIDHGNISRHTKNDVEGEKVFRIQRKDRSSIIHTGVDKGLLEIALENEGDVLQNIDEGTLPYEMHLMHMGNAKKGYKQAITAGEEIHEGKVTSLLKFSSIRDDLAPPPTGIYRNYGNKENGGIPRLKVVYIDGDPQ